MHRIVLHGILRRKYGKAFRMDVKSVHEAIRALCLQLKGFRKDIQDGSFRIAWVPDPSKPVKKVDISEPMLLLGLGNAGDIHISPVVQGAGFLNRGGWFVIAGAILLAAAFVLSPELALLSVGGQVGMATAGAMSATAISLGSLGAITYGQIAALGFGLMLMGAATLLSPNPTVSTDYQSMFAVPENNSQQGSAVPLVFGTFLVGSITISTGVADAAIPENLIIDDLPNSFQVFM